MGEQQQQTPPMMTPPSVAYSTPPKPPQQHDGLAIASFVLSLCALLVGALASIPAVITGHISRSRARQDGRAPSGLALAGLIIGYIGIGITALLVVVFVAAAAGRNSGSGGGSGSTGGSGGGSGSTGGGPTASANQTVCSDAQAVTNDVRSGAGNATITSDSNTMINDNSNLNDSGQLSNAVQQYNSDFSAGNYSAAGTDLSAINSICSNLGY
jgi:hypothetical protein